MPVTLQPTSLKYKNTNGQFQAATAIKGEDGISPTIGITDITGGHRITITDTTGARSFDVMDGPVQDVQIDGTSILSNGVANVPKLANGVLGVAKIGYSSECGLEINSAGMLKVSHASANNIKTGISSVQSITPDIQDASTFYGLAKAAGDATQSASANVVGTYTDDAKSAIRTMLGAGKVDDVQVNGVSVLNNGVANVPVGSSSTFGVFKRGTGLYDSNGVLGVNSSTDANVKSGDLGTYTAVSRQHLTVYYGLAKAAGADMKNITGETVGIYPDAQKAAIQHMLGTDTNLADYESDTTADQAYAVGELFMLNGKLHQATAAIAVNDTFTVGTNCVVVNVADVFPHDVQVNGTSVVSNGVANVPIASDSTLGTVKIPAVSGLQMINGGLYINKPDAAVIKNPSAFAGSAYRPIVPAVQHEATFYGLAKAAGDTTQSASSNAVGTYTESAKSAIAEMLGGSITVSGTTPTIAAKAWIQYICGEITSLSFTPSQTGICSVRFSTGATVPILTLPVSIKWANNFDPANLDGNTVYELTVTDGIYGVAVSWSI